MLTCTANNEKTVPKNFKIKMGEKKDFHIHNTQKGPTRCASELQISYEPNRIALHK